MPDYGLIELGFVFGVVLVAALWELYSVRKSLDNDRKTKSGDDGGNPKP